MDPLVVRSEDHRLTGAGLRAALAAARGSGLGGRGGGHVGHDQRRDHRRPGRRGRGGARAPAVVPRGRRLRRGRAVRAERPGSYDGIEHADSFIVDPHKWLFAPFDCAALLYRNPSIAKSVHTQDASYLDVIHDRPGEWNPTDYAYHLTRRARGLPLWFSLSVYGTDAYSEAIETAISAGPGGRGRDQDASRSRAHPRPVARGGAVPPARLGRPRSTPRGPTSCSRTRSRSYRRRRGRARRWRGSRSCTRTPRWTWCARSSTGWASGLTRLGLGHVLAVQVVLAVAVLGQAAPGDARVLAFRPDARAR